MPATFGWGFFFFFFFFLRVWAGGFRGGGGGDWLFQAKRTCTIQ